MIPVRKKFGSIRLCVNYQKINAYTKEDPFPIPSFDSIIEIINRNGGKLKN